MKNHIENIQTEINEGGWRGIPEFLSRLIHRKLLPEHRGTPIWDQEWDLLIILDACRYDLFEEVYPEFDFLTSVEQHRSVGSASIEWMERTFTEEYSEIIKNTCYITANPFSEEIVSKNQFARLEEVWRYGWDSDVGATPPRPVTDTAISAGRSNSNWEQLIVHYMQPHVPFLEYRDDGMSYGEFRRQDIRRLGDDWNQVLHQLQRREMSYKQFWDQYKSNLELVLNEVEILLRNIDAESVAISSDHGNALGERWLYGHPSGVDVPCLRIVPWSTITATDTEEHTPDDYEQDLRGDRERQLSALGYQ